MSTATAIATQAPGRVSLLSTMAAKFGVDPDKMLATLKATAFRGDVSNEQMMALLVVANQYNLNPWTKEIYAFPDPKAGIIPVISVDGWSRIINEQPALDGIEFLDDETGEWVECAIYRKDRAHPTRIREYLKECKRSTGPWGSHPRRMLRHKALIQCARVAFGFAGIYDPDEADRIREASQQIERAGAPTLTEQVRRKPREPIDVEPMPADPETTPAPTTDPGAPTTDPGAPTLIDLLAAIDKGQPAEDVRDAARGLSKEDRAKVEAAIDKRAT